jgi:hypothetical protein
MARRDVSETYERRGAAAATWAALREAASQLLYLAACPWLGFRCRFLRFDHRTLLAATPPADVLVRLRTGTSHDLDKDLAHVEGLFLRERTLRFANFTESRLYATDLIEADLGGAHLESAATGRETCVGEAARQLCTSSSAEWSWLRMWLRLP